MANAVRLHALVRAVAMLGSIDALARHLEQPVWRVELWLRGSVSIPPDAFMKVVDLLLERELSQMKEEAGRDYAERESGSFGETRK